MIFANEDPKSPGRAEQIAIAVTIAGLSTLVSGLISWGVEELRGKFGSKTKEAGKDNT